MCSFHVSVESCPEYLSSSNNAGQSVAATLDRDKPTHPNEELDHRLFSGASVVTPPPFLVFDYMDWYLTIYDVVYFRCMRNDGNEFQVWVCLGKRCDTSVAG